MGGGDQGSEALGGEGNGTRTSVAAVLHAIARAARMRPAPTGPRRRPLPARIALALCLASLGALVLSASALAQGSGEVKHAFSKSFPATGECALEEPGQVAVDDATGEIYVLELKHHKIVHLSAGGECLGPPHAARMVDSIAVDNSGGPSEGDVYVAVSSEVGSEERNLIFKLNSELKLIRSIKKYEAQFPEETEPHEEELLEHGSIEGLSVDSDGNLWVYGENGYIIGFNGEEKNKWIKGIETVHSCAIKPGFIAGPGGAYFYAGQERENRNGECEESTEEAVKGPVLVKLTAKGEPYVEPLHPATEQPAEDEPAYKAQLDNAPTYGAALDQASGEVYFDNATNVAAFSTIASFVQRFGASGEGALTAGRGTAFDAKTGDVLVVNGSTIDVYAPSTGEEPPATGESEHQLPDGRAYELVTPPDKHGSLLFGITAIDGPVQASAEGNAITFTSSGPVVAEPQANASPEPAANIATRGAGGWSTEDLVAPRSQTPIGFETDKGNEYKVFSENLSVGFLNPDQGVTEPEQLKLSPEASETTLYRRELNTGTDCFPVPSTCYQALVNPVNAPDAKPYAGLLRVLESTPDGNHAIVRAEAPLTEGGAEEGLYEWSAASGELSPVSVLPAGEAGEVEVPQLGESNPFTSSPTDMRNAVSSDGSHVMWSEGPSGEAKLFLRDTSTGETIRIDKVDAKEEKEGVPQPEVAGAVYQTANTEGTKIFFVDAHALTKNSTIHEEVTEETEEAGDLYECEVIATAGKLGCELHDLTADAAPNETAEVQAVLGASEDGSSVYFVANGALAEHGGRGNCTSKEAAEEEEERDGKRLPENCNLYVEHFNGTAWEAPTFIASLTGEDQHDWHLNVTGGGSLGSVTSRVSPNGSYLAFMSDRSLTGYDNDDAISGVPDEEVFEYNASDNHITCASCNPTKARPHGVLDSFSAKSKEGLGLLIDQQFNWTGAWLAANVPGWTPTEAQYSVYQSRYLDNSGRLFFNSVDDLVPADTNGKPDVYEYEPNTAGSCTSATGCVSLISSGSSTGESAFLDGSTTGNDVFFLTSQPLVEQEDHDTALDIYDARVCTESEPCLTPPPPPAKSCASEAECKGEAPASTLPALPGAPPSTQSGSGNSGTVVVLDDKTKVSPQEVKKAETRAQKLKAALKACKKDKKHKKRASCERQARKRYGAKKASVPARSSRKAEG